MWFKIKFIIIVPVGRWKYSFSLFFFNNNGQRKGFFNKVTVHSKLLSNNWNNDFTLGDRRNIEL